MKQVKIYRRLFMFVVFIFLVSICIVCVPWDAGYTALNPLPDTLEAEIDDAPRDGLEGIIVYVDQAGQPPALYAAGWMNRAAKISADAHSLFKIASISKLYIAAATAKLVAAKRLSLDDSLTYLLPNIAGHIVNADKITLRMMLRHRSGIPDYIISRNFRWGRASDQAEVLKLVLDKPSDFPPDTRHKYSNTNYLLIGMILDKILGYSHQDYIKAAILTPLGLTHTFGRMSDVNPSDIVSGYAVGYEGDMKPLDCGVPGGSMVATAEDVGVFLRALNTGRLLKADEQAIYSSIYVYEHTGLWAGYESIARFQKNIDTIVVEFVNTSGGNSWMKAEIEYDRIVRILRKQYKNRHL